MPTIHIGWRTSFFQSQVLPSRARPSQYGYSSHSQFPSLSKSLLCRHGVGRMGRGCVHAQRAIEIDPNDSHSRRILGAVLLYERNWEETKEQFDTALRFSPNNADAIAWMSQLFMAQIATGHYQEAVTALSRDEIYGTGSRELLILALALADRVPEAREEAPAFSSLALQIGESAL